MIYPLDFSRLIAEWYAAFDHLSGADFRLVWQELQMVIREDMALLYLSPAPRPEQFPE